MSNLHPKQKPASQDWHVADIKCALEKKGWSLSRLSKQRGYCRTACKMALRIAWPKMERIIADAIGVPPQVIWPSRYDEHGNSNRRRGRPKSNVTTAPTAGVIQQSQGN
jgi:Ner family transcriptional regulator